LPEHCSAEADVTPKTRRAREREEMRQLIKDAARKLFVAEGFEATTMRRIAEEIEYAPGAIYQYFEDKDAILYALHQDGFEKLYALERELDGVADPVKRLKELGKVYIGFGLYNPELYALMFLEPRTSKKMPVDGWPEGMRTFEYCRQCVEACIKAGKIRKTDPTVAAFSMWSMVHGLVSLVIRHRCPMIPEDQRLPVLYKGYEFLWSSFIAGASGPRPRRS
jgi:AcrR family transcriptional regulator